MKTNSIIALLLALMSGLMVQDQQPAQDKQPQTTKPDIVWSGDYTEWGGGPDGSFAKTGIKAPDGSPVTIYDYVYKSEKRINELLKNCTRDAVTVIEDGKITNAKGKLYGRRIIAVFRDSEGRESAVLCRSENKKMLTRIHGKTVEHVLGFERTAFPK